MAIKILDYKKHYTAYEGYNATGGNVTIQLWGYHAAFDEWGILTVLDVTDGSGSAIAITGT